MIFWSIACGGSGAFKIAASLDVVPPAAERLAVVPLVTGPAATAGAAAGLDRAEDGADVAAAAGAVVAAAANGRVGTAETGWSVVADEPPDR